MTRRPPAVPVLSARLELLALVARMRRDAVALDHQLGVLADETAQTDPWTAALTTGDPR